MCLCTAVNEIFWFYRYAVHQRLFAFLQILAVLGETSIFGRACPQRSDLAFTTELPSSCRFRPIHLLHDGCSASSGVTNFQSQSQLGWWRL
jgi:hypothetical protein